MNRRGFSSIELLTTLAVLGILANIALPVTRIAKRRADEARVVADVHAARGALIEYFADNDDFPPSSGPGTVPNGLDAYLRGGFTFDYKDNRYGWINLRGRRFSFQFLYVWGTDPKLIERVADSYAGRSVQWGVIAILYID